MPPTTDTTTENQERDGDAQAQDVEAVALDTTADQQPDSDAQPTTAPTVPQEEAEETEPARPRVGQFSYSEWRAARQAEQDAEFSRHLERPVWLEALGVEGAVRVLRTSQELDVQKRLYADTEAVEDGAPSAQGERARRAERNRRRILLALELCAAEPSFTEEEAATAIEADDSALVVGPLFNGIALLNPVFQFEPLDEANDSEDVELLVAKSQTRAFGILQHEKAAGGLSSILARSRFEPVVSAAVQPAIDQATLLTDLLTSPKLDLLKRLVSAIEAHQRGEAEPAKEPPSMPTADLLALGARQSQQVSTRGASCSVAAET